MATREIDSNAIQTVSSTGISEKVRAVMLAIKQQWPNTQIDLRDPAAVWSNAIDSLNVSQIKYGIGRLKDEIGEFALTPAQFRAIAKCAPTPRASIAERKAPASEKDLAWWATRAMYGNRCNNRGGLAVRVPELGYHGGFDFRAVAMETPLPPLEVHDHQWWSDLLKENFEARWRAYAG